MIIGIDGHMLGDRSGGNESYFTNILLNMKLDLSGGNTYILFVRKGFNADKFKKLGFNIVEFESSSAFRRVFIEIPKLCRKYKLDVIHMQYFIPLSRPCPIVCTIHDICFEHHKDIFTKKEYIRQKILIPYAARNSRIILTDSQYSKNDIIDKYKIDPDKIVLTYNAADESFHKINSDELNVEELKSKFNIGDSSYILSVGNLQPRKNLPRLIRAFIKAQDRLDNNVKLVIVGKKAWMYNDIIKEAIGNGDKIIFTDYVSKEDLVRLYNGAVGFIYPSFFEGFGLPPLEAMACGTPVAVSNKTSIPEVVGDAGIYFDPYNEEEIENSIIELVNLKTKRDEFIEAGLRRAKAFDWKKTAEIILNTYYSFDHNKNASS